MLSVKVLFVRVLVDEAVMYPLSFVRFEILSPDCKALSAKSSEAFTEVSNFVSSIEPATMEAESVSDERVRSISDVSETERVFCLELRAVCKSVWSESVPVIEPQTFDAREAKEPQAPPESLYSIVPPLSRNP